MVELLSFGYLGSSQALLNATSDMGHPARTDSSAILICKSCFGEPWQIVQDDLALRRENLCGCADSETTAAAATWGIPPFFVERGPLPVHAETGHSFNFQAPTHVPQCNAGAACSASQKVHPP